MADGQADGLLDLPDEGTFAFLELLTEKKNRALKHFDLDILCHFIACAVLC